MFDAASSGVGFNTLVSGAGGLQPSHECERRVQAIKYGSQTTNPSGGNGARARGLDQRLVLPVPVKGG